MSNMICIRMPRCGSTSMIDFCKRNNISIYGGGNMGFWGDGKMLKKNTDQQLYKCISNYVGESVYNDSFIFTTVRNPYSRAVSMFMHNSWNSIENFHDFCDSIKRCEYPSAEAEWHCSRMTDHLTDGEVLKVDFVVRIEKFQQDVDILCEKVGIPRWMVSHQNKSNHKHYTEYYDDRTRSIVAERYARDIEMFGYEFEY